MTTHEIRGLALVGLLALAPFLTGCEGQNAKKLDGDPPPPKVRTQPSQTAPADPQDAPAQPTGGTLQLAGVSFTPDPAWRDLGPAPMLKAKYQLPPVEGDEVVAELNVAYYGQQMGGDVEANLARWIGQMNTPDGGEASSIAVRSKLTTSNGLDIHFVEIDGTYLKSMGGGPMTGGRKKPMPDHRLVGAIVEAPEGNVFIKMVGPEKTAAVMEEQLRKMLGAATKI